LTYVAHLFYGYALLGKITLDKIRVMKKYQIIYAERRRG